MTKHEWKQSWGSVRFFVKYEDTTHFDSKNILAFNLLIKRNDREHINDRFALAKHIFEDVPF